MGAIKQASKKNKKNATCLFPKKQSLVKKDEGAKKSPLFFFCGGGEAKNGENIFSNMGDARTKMLEGTS